MIKTLIFVISFIILNYFKMSDYDSYEFDDDNINDKESP
jgi:hypothetical protein